MQGFGAASVTVAAILTGAVAVGAFLDKYTSLSTKRKAWSNISQTDETKLTAKAVNIVVLAYESIFGSDIASYSFFLRSLTAYILVVILLVSVLFLTSRIQFMWIASPFLTGRFFDGLLAAGLIVAASLLFWAANAQTLYFLRLAQRDPRPTPVFLIFYADTLLTASICVLGVGTLLWLHSAAYLATGERRLTLEVRVQSAEAALDEDLLERGSGASRLAYHVEQDRPFLQSESVLSVRNIPSATAEALFRRDFDMVMSLMPASGIRVRRRGDSFVQLLRPNGEIFSYDDRDTSLRTRWDRDFKGAANASVVCRQILDIERSRALRYVRINGVEFLNGWNSESCLRGLPGRMRVNVAINRSNISQSELLFMHFAFVLEDLPRATLNGVRSSSAIHPLFHLSRRPTGGFSEAWIYRPVISEFDRSGEFDLDVALISSYMAEDGIRNLILRNSLPTGSIISAIMATSLFTVLLLSGALLAGILGSSARLLNALDRVMIVRKYPFVFVFLFAGLLVSAIEVFVTLS